MDYAEAAQALGIPLGTVKSRLARARLHMHRKLKDNLIYDPGLEPSEVSLAT
jgi:RNA polymerase sigma-70 factor (ECF subfamily)